MMEKVKKYRPIILLIVLFILLALLYSQNRTADNSSSKITLAVIQQPALSLMFIADKNGYFQEEGINVDFIKYTLGRDAINDTIEGKADLATVYDIPTLNQISNGVDLGILATLHSSKKNHTVAAFKDKGISNAEDLKGKRVAMTKGVSTEFFLYALLMAEGVDFNELTIVSIEPAELIQSLEDGSVDAAVLFNPYIFLFQDKYQDELTFLYSDAYTEMSVLTGKKEVIADKKNEVLKVLKALYKAEQFIKNNKEESVRLASEWLGNDTSELVNFSWDIFDFSLTLNNKLLTTMERESRFFVNAGVYDKNTPYLREYFLTDFLKEVKPEGVTIY